MSKHLVASGELIVGSSTGGNIGDVYTVIHGVFDDRDDIREDPDLESVDVEVTYSQVYFYNGGDLEAGHNYWLWKRTPWRDFAEDVLFSLPPGSTLSLDDIWDQQPVPAQDSDLA